MASINRWKLPERDAGEEIPECPIKEEWAQKEWTRIYSYSHVSAAMFSIVLDLIIAMKEERELTITAINGNFSTITQTGQGAWKRSPILQMRDDAQKRVSNLREILAITPKAIARLNNGAEASASNGDKLLQALDEITDMRGAK